MRNNRVSILFIVFLMLFSSISFAEDKNTEIVYFYITGCTKCAEAESFLDSKDITIYKYNIKEIENMALIKELEKKHNKQETIVPAVVIGDNFLVGVDEIKAELENHMRENLDFDFSKGVSSQESLYVNNFESFSFWGILFAGLVDGINPCAISILMLFASFMIFTGKKNKAILLSGVLFILGTFIANVSIGLLYFKIFEILNYSNIFISIIYILSLIMISIFLIINSMDIYEYFKTKGNEKRIINQLTFNVKSFIMNIIRKSLNLKAFYFIIFIVGFIVGLSEFSCTGQIYVPTLTYMFSNFASSEAIMMIIGYNLMFTLPLIIVMMLVFKVDDPDIIKMKVMNNSFMIKIIGNVIFIVLFILILKDLLLIF